MKEQESYKWAHDLSVALKKWYSEHGYKSGMEFARELNIKRGPWENVARGLAIVERSDPTLYAKLYFWTGLPEADPATIPPKKITGATQSLVHRAWTTQKYQDWLRTDEAVLLAAKKVQKWPENNGQKLEVAELQPSEESRDETSTALPAAGFLPTTLGAWIDLFIDAFAGQVADRVASRNAVLSAKIDEVIRLLTLQSAQFPAETMKLDVSGIAELLLAALQPVINGSAKDRDQFLLKHGDSVKKVYIILDWLTDNPESRERNLPSIKRGGV